MGRRVGILTGGGDAPGLNAVIRAVVKYGVGVKGWHLTGVEDSFNGLLTKRPHVHDLNPRVCKGLLGRGGTILGTTNHGDPFDFPEDDGSAHDRTEQVQRVLKELEIEGLIVIGGDGTQRIAWRLMQERGIKVVGVPKTIDNDLGATDITFGFQSAVDCVTDALDRLHTTAESHDRVLVLEVMGRDAGFIALHGGIAGGADVILLPEIPWDPARVAGKIEERRRRGRPFSLIVTAESAHPIGEAAKIGRAGSRVIEVLTQRMPKIEARLTVLGHLQRGGSPCAFDRVMATRMGVGAVDLVEGDRWGHLVALRDGKIVGVPLAEAVASNRYVDPFGEVVHTARSVGVEFGG
jgi:ATP-dependent phosphofructokinase / diphosphate-dependent phosphofructokinase